MIEITMQGIFKHDDDSSKLIVRSNLSPSIENNSYACHTHKNIWNSTITPIQTRKTKFLKSSSTLNLPNYRRNHIISGFSGIRTSFLNPLKVILHPTKRIQLERQSFWRAIICLTPFKLSSKFQFIRFLWLILGLKTSIWNFLIVSWHPTDWTDGISAI